MLDLQAVKQRSAGVTFLGGIEDPATALRLERTYHAVLPSDGVRRSTSWEASARCANLVPGFRHKEDMGNVAPSQDMDEVPRVPWEPVETGLGWLQF